MKQKNLSTSGIKITLKILAVFVVLVVFLAAAQRLLVPKYRGEMAGTTVVSEYYGVTHNNEVVLVGDSEMYYNFVPSYLKEEYDLNAYVRGSANLTMAQSYYLLLDTLRYEIPEVVVISVASMPKDESTDEASNRMLLDEMKWSKVKAECIKETMLEEENFISYVFPILRFHSRWSELSEEDFKYYFSRPNISDRGYIERNEVEPMGELPAIRPLLDYEFAKETYGYLDKIREVCSEKNIKLVLVKSPSMYPYWYEEWDEQVKKYANENNLTYVNLLEYTEEIGLDFSKDTFDGGKHLNKSGAIKNTDYFAKILLEELKEE